jgi:hypothetical protein
MFGILFLIYFLFYFNIADEQMEVDNGKSEEREPLITQRQSSASPAFVSFDSIPQQVNVPYSFFWFV